MRSTISIQSLSKRNALGVLGLAILLLLLGLGQDYIQSSLRQYGFFVSESLLFNSFWVFFIPLSFLQLKLQKTKRSFSFYNKSVKLTVLVLSSTLLHILLFATFVFLVSMIGFNHSYGFSRMLSYSLSEKLFITLVIYTAVFLITTKLNQSKVLPKMNKDTYLDQLVIQSAGKSILIKTEELISITAFSPYIKLNTTKGEFVYSESLKSFLEKLNPEKFVRIHKSTAINLKEVKSYKSRQNGDYDIMLSNGKEVRMSRNYSSVFKAQLA
jgi:two-component system, LytTR family, response regulator